MPPTKRHNAKGRTLEHYKQTRRGNWSPTGGFVAHSRSMLASAAYRILSIGAHRILIELELDHLNRGGAENGRLIATHEQLRERGVPANSIRPAIDELEELGFIRFKRGGRWGSTNRPSLFRLTYLQDEDGNPPTDEWRTVDEEKAKNWKKERAIRNAGRKKRKATRTL